MIHVGPIATRLHENHERPALRIFGYTVPVLTVIVLVVVMAGLAPRLLEMSVSLQAPVVPPVPVPSRVAESWMYGVGGR